MNRFEYKLEFESKFEDMHKIINKINNILANSELGECVINIKPTFTILDGEENDV